MQGQQDSETFVPCVICNNSANEQRLWPVASGTLVQCRVCGLYYVNPRKEDRIRRVASGNTSSQLDKAKSFNTAGRLWEFQRCLCRLEEFRSPPGDLLDIGFYDGLFLKEAQRRGWRGYGVEPHKGGAAFARETLGLSVHTGLLDENAFPGLTFDVVCMLSVLEHTPNPLLVLREIRKRITPDGVLLLVVPTVPFYLRLVRSRWRMFIGEHYYFFTDRSMGLLLAEAGFTVATVTRVAKSVDLETILARLRDPWQPYRIGRLGNYLATMLDRPLLRKLRFRINLFDVTEYIARPSEALH